jgi:uncharacterized GH25 family protein
MINYNWQAVTKGRQLSDGFVEVVHYNVTATEDAHTASTYGSVSFTKQPDKTYTPYTDLIEEQVVGWVQDALGKDTVEASLAGQIEALKNPTEATGLPWSAA